MKSKIIDINTIKNLKQANLTYGLCHGAFDLVHPGHVKHFESAKKLCDKLIVSLTSDFYVQKRKGANRPIYTEQERAYIISCLEFVDYVVISPYDTAIETLELIKPDLYIKGPDYKNKQTSGILKEKQAIESLGGRLVFTDDEKYSTSDLLDKISKTNRPKMLLVLDRDGTLIEEKSFLGKHSDWRENIVLKRPVVDFIHYLKQSYNLTIIVISNQAGVARGYFTPEIVQEINRTIECELNKEGIFVAAWEFCPDVDLSYATKQELDNFLPEYVKETTDRKPSPNMLFKTLQKLNMSLSDFDTKLVLGDRAEDEELARNIEAGFVNVTDKSYEEIVEDIKKLGTMPPLKRQSS
jgi:rfaE bifunctional protein nucleotidyltransferase chain/domain